jgi:hypothetical protein
VNKVFDVLTYALGVSAILVLTRPGSQGPAFVTSLGNSAVHLVQGASGQPVKG